MATSDGGKPGQEQCQIGKEERSVPLLFPGRQLEVIGNNNSRQIAVLDRNRLTDLPVKSLE